MHVLSRVSIHAGNTGESISEIQKYEREYFAKSKLFQYVCSWIPLLCLLHMTKLALFFLRNGMLRESQLSTRNMVNAVTEEFWKMVNGSIYDQSIQFKSKHWL